MAAEVIDTERLRLVALSAADVQAVLAGDRAGRRWSPGYPTDGDVEVAGIVAESGLPPDPVWGPKQVRLRDGDLAVGGIGFLGPPDADGAVGVGYGLAEEVRGRGLATEALRHVVAYAFARGARRVLADTTPDNGASQRVLAKAGFRLVAEDDSLRYYAYP